MKRYLLATLVLFCMALQGVAMASETVVPASSFQAVTGTWTVAGNAIKNTDTSKNNTNAYARVAQQGSEITYEWTISFSDTVFSSGPAAGMHLMGTDGTNDLRGTSYLVFQDKTNIRLYIARGGKLVKNGDLPTPEVTPGQVHQYKVVFNTATGVMNVWRDGQEMGSMTDATPLSGDIISLRTNGTVAEFKDIKVTVK